MNSRRRIAVVAVLLVGLSVAAWTGLARADADEQETGARDRPRSGLDFSMLVEGLHQTPGCLGVEVAQFQSGKLAIFAWFEDKAAVVRWYEHPVHRGAREAFFPDGPPDGYTPMAHVTDESKPLLVAATLVPNRDGGPEGPPLRQISIELYQPLPGGLAVGGRLAPSDVDVPHMLMRDGF